MDRDTRMEDFLMPGEMDGWIAGNMNRLHICRGIGRNMDIEMEEWDMNGSKIVMGKREKGGMKDTERLREDDRDG